MTLEPSHHLHRDGWSLGLEDALAGEPGEQRERLTLADSFLVVEHLQIPQTLVPDLHRLVLLAVAPLPGPAERVQRRSETRRPVRGQRAGPNALAQQFPAGLGELARRAELTAQGGEPERVHAALAQRPIEPLAVARFGIGPDDVGAEQERRELPSGDADDDESQQRQRRAHDRLIGQRQPQREIVGASASADLVRSQTGEERSVERLSHRRAARAEIRHDDAQHPGRVVFEPDAHLARDVPELGVIVLVPVAAHRSGRPGLEALDGDFDVIHFHDYKGLGFYTCEGRRQGIALRKTRIVLQLHGPTRWTVESNRQFFSEESQLIADRMERGSVEMADVRVSPSDYLAGWVRTHWNLPDTCEIETIPNLCSLLEQRLRRTRRRNASKEGTGPIRNLVIFGRHEARKGIDVASSALSRLDDLLVERLRPIPVESKHVALPNNPVAGADLHQYAAD